MGQGIARLARLAAGIVLPACVLVTPAFAITSLGGGAASIGEAGAVVARAVELDAIHINPASIVGARGGEILLGAAAQKGELRFTPPSNGLELEGPERTFSLPQFSGVFPLTDRWSLGASLGRPHLLRVEWPDELADSLSATEGEFTTTSLSAAVGWKRSERLSLGIGVQFVQEDVTVRSGRWALPEDPGERGRSVFHVDGVGTALIMGLIYRTGEQTVIGASLTGINHIGSEGTAEFEVPAAFDSSYQGGTARAALEVPATVRFGIAHAPASNWLVEVDAEWVGSQVLRQIDFTVGEGDSVHRRDFGWRDAIVVRTGAHFDVTPAITLRGGYAWDRSLGASSNVLHPGKVEHTVTAGAGFGNHPLRADFAAAWSRRTGTHSGTTGMPEGEMTSQALTFAATVRYRFDDFLP